MSTTAQVYNIQQSALTAAGLTTGSTGSAGNVAPGETSVHSGDWTAFVIWSSCFLLMAFMNFYDLFASLLGL